MSTEDPRVDRLQKALSQLEPVEYDTCASRIAHESGVVLRCQRKHMRGTTNRMHATKGGVCWRDDDERIVDEPQPVGSTPVSEEPAGVTWAEAERISRENLIEMEARRSALAEREAEVECPGGHECPNYSQTDLDAAYARGISEGRRRADEEIERLQALLDQAEQYARDFQDEAGWDRTEEWALSYRLNGTPKPPEYGGHIFDSREDAERHIEAWRRHYPDLTYTDEVYHRREVLTGEWQPETGDSNVH